MAPASARGILHDRHEETPEAKARWFQSLPPLSERTPSARSPIWRSRPIPTSHISGMLNRLRDVVASLNRYNAHYVVIGGIAAVLHGVLEPRSISTSRSTRLPTTRVI
jgi:hypothetical protein